MTKKTNALRLLDQEKINYHCIAYHYDSEDLSLEKIAADNNLIIEQVYKTLVAKGDKTGVIVALIGGDKQLSFKKIATLSGNKKVALVAVKEIPVLTGYIRGACSPLGMKKNYPIYIDIAATDFDTIYVNAGVRGLLLGIAPQDLLRVTAAQSGDLADL